SAARCASRRVSSRMAPRLVIPRPETLRVPHIKDGSCAAGTGSCRPALRKFSERAAEHGHHGAADLDSLGDVFRLAVRELNVDEALPPHLGALLADDLDLRPPLDEAVLDRVGAE